jgi:thiosulfate/3-mercaptopyruvate sulfurtransferase
MVYFKLAVIVFITLFSQTASAETLRMTLTELQAQLDNKNLIILDTRKPDVYESGHVPGARNYPVTLTYHNKSVNGQISQPADTQKIFRALGLEKDSSVIIYDNGDLIDAARLFWTLEVYGLTRVKVLSQGFDAWSTMGLPVSSEKPSIKASHYIATINHKRLASKFSTQLATKNRQQLIIDARKTSDYLGETSSAQRFGHIPTAISIPASHNFEKYKQFSSLKPVDALSKVYESIPKNNKVVIYCAIGRVSASNYLALRELGYDVSNYDASWNEWGNDFNLPIEK